MCAGCHGTVLPFYASALSCESRFTPSAETFFSKSSFVFFIRSLIIQSTDVVTSSEWSATVEVCLIFRRFRHIFIAFSIIVIVVLHRVLRKRIGVEECNGNKKFSRGKNISRGIRRRVHFVTQKIEHELKFIRYVFLRKDCLSSRKTSYHNVYKSS